MIRLAVRQRGSIGDIPRHCRARYIGIGIGIGTRSLVYAYAAAVLCGCVIDHRRPIMSFAKRGESSRPEKNAAEARRVGTICSMLIDSQFPHLGYDVRIK